MADDADAMPTLFMPLMPLMMTLIIFAAIFDTLIILHFRFRRFHYYFSLSFAASSHDCFSLSYAFMLIRFLY